MPKLELYDQNGKKHNLSDYKGKVVFLNFYATWCHYCNQEIAHINKLYKEFGENKQDVIFLGELLLLNQKKIVEMLMSQKIKF